MTDSTTAVQDTVKMISLLFGLKKAIQELHDMVMAIRQEMPDNKVDTQQNESYSKQLNAILWGVGKLVNDMMDDIWKT